MAKISLTDLWNQLQAWMKRTDNPHKVNAGQVGAYTKEELDSILEGYLSAGTLPVSVFGSVKTTTLDVGVSTNLGVAKITIRSGAVNTMLAGTQVPFKTLNWSFTTTKGNTLYLYLSGKVVDGKPEAQITSTDTPRAETSTNFYIGMVRWNDTTNCECLLAPVVMLDVYRLSANPRGSAIPVSSGKPTETGTFNWG